ncbi:MAG TPA: beta-propeller fold lactonase family protein [Terriglobales bacterium]|nr:beta-propeller fold lactonase family protein [Terriglobales bacterium]
MMSRIVIWRWPVLVVSIFVGFALLTGCGGAASSTSSSTPSASGGTGSSGSGGTSGGSGGTAGTSGTSGGSGSSSGSGSGSSGSSSSGGSGGSSGGSGSGSGGGTSGGSGSGSSGGGSAQSAQYLFVDSNFVASNTSVVEYSINSSNGALTKIGSVQPATGNNVDDMTVDAKHHRLYVMQKTPVPPAPANTKVFTYEVDPGTGNVTQSSAAPYTTTDELAFPVISVDARFMFTGDYATPSLFHTLLLDSASGAVTQQGETTQASEQPTAVMQPAVEPNGKYVYAANAENNHIYGFSINGGVGTLTFVPGVPFTVGSTTSGCPPKSPYCAAPMAFANGYLYMVDTAFPELVAFKIDQGTGSLTGVAGSPFTTGNTTYDSIATTPNGKFLYAASSLSSVLAGWSLDPSTGIATPIPGSPWTLPGSSQWSAVVVDTTGQYVYASNTSSLTGWKIDPGTGALTALSGSPFSTNANATRIAIVP